EPLATSAFVLAAGGLLRHGVELTEARPIRDIAPTLSVILGVRAPTSSLARPMLDLLSLDELEASIVIGAPFDQTAHFLCRLTPQDRCAEVDPILARLRPSDPRKIDPTAGEDAAALLDALTSARDRSLATKAEEARPPRLAIAAGVIVALGGLA